MKTHEDYMRIALKEAEKAAKEECQNSGYTWEKGACNKDKPYTGNKNNNDDDDDTSDISDNSCGCNCSERTINNLASGSANNSDYYNCYRSENYPSQNFMRRRR